MSVSRMCSSKSSGRSCLVVRRAMTPSSPGAGSDEAMARRSAMVAEVRGLRCSSLALLAPQPPSVGAVAWLGASRLVAGAPGTSATVLLGASYDEDRERLGPGDDDRA